MNVDEFEKTIDFLGKSHPDLLTHGVISDEPLLEIFPGADTIFLEPEDGVELTFSSEGEVFIKLFIILKTVTPSMIEYKGDLPGNLTRKMNQAFVRELFGEPKTSHGPVRLPQPTGWTGGWDTYDYDKQRFPGVELIFKYTAEMDVNTLVFKKPT